MGVKELNAPQLGLFVAEEPGQKRKTLRVKSATANKFISSVWSFPGSGGDQLYRWYGTLPRPLIEQLLSLYAPKGSNVVDPFAGLGTTLDVAADLGLRAIGLDVNPLACLVARARLEGLPQKESLLKAMALVESSVGARESRELWGKFKNNTRFDYTRKWFREDTLEALLSLLAGISAVKDARVQRLMFVGAAQVIRAVASVDPRCTHHLVTKKKPFQDPVPQWQEYVLSIASRVRSRPAAATDISVRQESVLAGVLPQESADFVLLHPPYLGVIHYHLIHRLATDLLDFISTTLHAPALKDLDFSYESLKAGDMSTDREERYSEAVKLLAIQMRRVVRKTGRCAVIIGDQRHKGNLRHPFTDFVREFEAVGFKLEENFIWLLQNNGGMHVLRRGHFIDHNYILVFRAA